MSPTRYTDLCDEIGQSQRPSASLSRLTATVLRSRVMVVCIWRWSVFFFFFQAEDGIRDLTVTGVQTCALPIYRAPDAERHQQKEEDLLEPRDVAEDLARGHAIAALLNQCCFYRARSACINSEIGRASCRERV